MYNYYNLTKPRLTMMNVLVAAAAFVFASQGIIEWKAFILMALGLAGVVGSACVFNNYADRALDRKMERTQGRALAAGTISPRSALIFGLALLAGGAFLLSFVSLLALSLALAGFAVYVFLYTPLKTKTPYALYVGALAGAMPPLVGYTAAAGRLDYLALLLFLFLFLWQIPHFLAIARFRHAEYSAAGVPLLVGAPKNEDERRRARKIFHASLALLLVFCIVLTTLLFF